MTRYGELVDGAENSNTTSCLFARVDRESKSLKGYFIEQGNPTYAKARRNESAGIYSDSFNCDEVGTTCAG